MPRVHFVGMFNAGGAASVSLFVKHEYETHVSTHSPGCLLCDLGGHGGWNWVCAAAATGTGVPNSMARPNGFGSQPRYRYWDAYSRPLPGCLGYDCGLRWAYHLPQHYKDDDMHAVRADHSAGALGIKGRILSAVWGQGSSVEAVSCLTTPCTRAVR
jgi:hypothetical protein